MKTIVIAAGYATRLYPLTKNFPKPLLEIGDNTILGRMLDDIDTIPGIDSHIIVTNHKFTGIFEGWKNKTRYTRPITIIDDGTETNETRLGAVRDIRFAVDSLGLDDDLLVIAGDNLLDFSLCRFVDYALEKGSSCIMRYYEPDPRKLRRSGVVCVDEDDRVLSMEEKPAEPASHWCCPPFYFYTRDDARLTGDGIEAGCGTDAPGSFVAWLARRRTVYAMEMPGKRYDIGNLESYKAVCASYQGIVRP